MLKCNLEDLYVVSDEVARYCGYCCQLDLYVSIIIYFDNLEDANSQLQKMEKIYYPCRRLNGPSLSEYIIKTENYKSIYGTLASVSSRIEDDYPKVLAEYPNFNDFVKSITNTKSPTDFSRFQ